MSYTIKRSTMATALAVTLVAGASAQEGERFSNDTAGLSIVRPAGWRTGSMRQVASNRQRVRLSDEKLQAALQNATAPLFVFFKHEEPHDGLNPSIQITLRPLGRTSALPPRDILKIVAGTLPKVFPDFSTTGGIEDTTVGGLDAAHLRATYTLTNTSGARFPVLTRMWLVPRGGFVFLIGMAGPQDGPDVSEAEFEAALASIEIAR